MPTVLLLTTSSHPEANGNCDVAVVTITPALAQRILKRIMVLQTLRIQDGSLHQLRYWDNAVDYACLHARSSGRRGLALDEPRRVGRSE